MAEFGEPLSPREEDVLEQLTLGLSNKEIAETLVISPNTVKVHVRNVLTKLGVNSRTEAVALALKEGQETDYPSVSEEIVEKPLDQSVQTAEPAVSGNLPTEPAKRRFWIPALGALALMLLLVVGGWIAVGRNGASNAVPTPQAEFIPEPMSESGWTTLRPLSEPLAHFAMTSSGLSLYQIGGEVAGGEIVGMSRLYDIQAHTWQDIAPKPTAVADASAVLLAGQIYVIGGRTADGATSVVEVYSPVNDAWRTASSLPEPVYGAVAVTLGDEIYVLSGMREGGSQPGVSPAVFVYDAGGDRWRPVESLPTARAFAGGGVVDNTIVVAGGTDGDNDLAVCEKYDPMAGAWSACADLLNPRAGGQGIALFNRLYLLGGGLNENVPFGEVLDVNSGEWGVVNVPVLDSAESYTHYGVALVETTFYLAGGKVDGENTDQQYSYSSLPVRLFIPSVQDE